MEEKDSLLKIQPKFNFIYEMFMPTGRKLRNTLFFIIIFIICYFFINIALTNINISETFVTKHNNIDMIGMFNIIAICFIIILIIKFVIQLIVQIMQYNSIKYTFYNDYLEYEDTFLNQHRKSLRYNNVKEIEIRRTVWDRLNGYGMIIIYSNAEKIADKGLILYSIKNPEEIYSRIDEIVHIKYSVQEENINPIKGVNPTDMATEKEIEFKESLNNKE